MSQSLCVSSKDWSSKCILLYLWCSKDAHQEIEEEKRKTENLQKYVLIAILFFAVKTLNMFVTKLKTTSYTLQRKQRIVRGLWKKEGTVKKVGEYHCLWKKNPVINIQIQSIMTVIFKQMGKRPIYSNKQIKNLPSGDIASLRQENETLKNR